MSQLKLVVDVFLIIKSKSKGLEAVRGARFRAVILSKSYPWPIWMARLDVGVK
ncbi:MAG: hypothetical protein LBV23_09615 [Deltaproteobacteria bacterium]|nr:hypothetical protein [Deltaproteobacteria bacterium]